MGTGTGAIIVTGAGIATATGAGAGIAGTGVTGAGTGIIIGTAAIGEANQSRANAKIADSANPYDPRKNKTPRQRGFVATVLTVLNRAAGAVTPDQAIGTAAGYHDNGGAFDHDRTWRNHDHAAIGNASPIGTAMVAGAASAGGIGGAKACDGACNHNCCEKVLHVFSLHWAARRRRAVYQPV
jgi:hypothetical protein